MPSTTACSRRRLALHLDIPYSALLYWEAAGFVPPPSLVLGKRSYYTDEEIRIIRDYRTGWGRVHGR